MKRWQIIILAFSLVAATLSGCVLTTEPSPSASEPTTESTTEPSQDALLMEDLICLVQIHNTLVSIGGVKDQPRYEYYAIGKSGVEQVNEETVKGIAPEVLFKNLRKGPYFGSAGTYQWYIKLMYAPQVEAFESEDFLYRNSSWMPTDLGENFRVYYSYWGPGHANQAPPLDPEVTKVMLQAAHFSYTTNPDVILPESGLPQILEDFMVTVNDGRILLEAQAVGLFLPMEDGSLLQVFETDQALISASYFWFPPQ